MIESFRKHLDELGLSDEFDAMIERAFEETVDEFVQKIRVMIDYWESVVEDDQSLYTLGLRRCIDMAQGTAAYDQLPVLETEDTPNE